MSAPFMQLYVADYLGDTQHLTTEQHGAYLLLLMTMWRSDGALPADDEKLARIVRLPLARWNKIKGDILALLTIEGGLLTQRRLRSELGKAKEKSLKRSDAGRAGGTAKSLKYKDVSLANATVLPEHLSEPDSELESKKKEEKVRTTAGALAREEPTHPEPHALPAAAPGGASACAAPAPPAKSHAERVCEAMGVRLNEDAKRLNWPGQIAAALGNGLTVEDLIESAKAAKEREIRNIAWVLKRAHGVKAEQRIGAEQRAPPVQTERVSQVEWHTRLTMFFKGVTSHDDWDDVDDVTPVGTWLPGWGPKPGNPGCLAPPKLMEEFAKWKT